jgi:hypothetical protein
MYVNYIMLKEESAAPGRPNVDEAHSAIHLHLVHEVDNNSSLSILVLFFRVQRNRYLVLEVS